MVGSEPAKPAEDRSPRRQPGELGAFRFESPLPRATEQRVTPGSPLVRRWSFLSTADAGSLNRIAAFPPADAGGYGSLAGCAGLMNRFEGISFPSRVWIPIASTYAKDRGLSKVTSTGVGTDSLVSAFEFRPPTGRRHPCPTNARRSALPRAIPWSERSPDASRIRPGCGRDSWRGRAPDRPRRRAWRKWPSSNAECSPARC